MSGVFCLGVERRPQFSTSSPENFSALKALVSNKAGVASFIGGRHAYDVMIAILHEKLDDTEIEALPAAGAQLSEDQAVAEALSVTLVAAP